MWAVVVEELSNVKSMDLFPTFEEALQNYDEENQLHIKEFEPFTYEIYLMNVLEMSFWKEK